MQVRVIVDTPAMPLGLVGEMDTDETVTEMRGCYYKYPIKNTRISHKS